MSNKILLKRSLQAAKVPTSGDLDAGELAINLTDFRLYAKDAGNTVRGLNDWNNVYNKPTGLTNATAANTASTLVLRDASGNFAAGTITADLTGNVTGDVIGNVTGDVIGNVTGSASNNVLKAGDTMTGFLTLHANPTSDLHAATKQYVDQGAAIWGNVSGTLSDQTDLQTALNSKANNTVQIVTNGGLQGGGDLTTTRTLSLTDTGVTANSYGSASNAVSFTVDAKGRISTASATAIAIAASQVTSGTFNNARIAVSNVTQHQGAIAIAASQVTSGSFDNARIAASNVTQHQAALTILESQITDGALLARVAGNETITGAWTYNNPVTVGAPTQSGHAATKQYVDELAEGLKAKPAAKAATTTNLSGTYDNGTAGEGATLNLGTMATLNIDGITTWSVFDGVLVKDQTNKAHNGRYYISQVGNGSTDWILTRCFLCDTANEIPGAYIFVFDGTQNKGTGWVKVVDDPSTFTVGTDPIDVIQFSGAGTYTAGTGLSLSGTEFSLASGVVSPSTYTKVTVDTYGRVTAGASLVAADIPNLDASKITSGVLNNARTSGTSANTVNTLVLRDASGNFSAGTITATLSGNASTATTLETARTINGVSFNGSANITVTANTPNTLTRGTGLTGSNFNGSSATTWAVAYGTTAGTACEGNDSRLSTNLGITAGTTAGPIVTSSTGTNATLPTATASASGVVTTGAQTWAGNKTFNDTVTAATFNATSTTDGGFQGIAADAVGSPSFTWTGDLTTGMYRVGASDIGFACGGVHRGRVNANGFVGVGTHLTALNGSNITSGTVANARTTATSANTANTIVLRDASGNFSAGVITATVTQARYADLAENYVADAAYEPGTVVCFGGEYEVTLCNSDACRRVAGVVSTNPAHLMNADCEGEHVAAIALQGRVPVKVIGKVRKGDLMVSAKDGKARAWSYRDGDENSGPRIGTVIGKALADFDGGEGVIEVVVGRL